MSVPALTTPIDDYSEFLETPPAPREQPPNDTAIEEGCIAEFGNCLKFSMCGEGYVQEEQVQAEMMQALDQSSLVDAKTTQTSVEQDLPTELACGETWIWKHVSVKSRDRSVKVSE